MRVPGYRRPALSPIHFSVRELSSLNGSRTPFCAIFAEFQHTYFWKTAEWTLFGLIRHKAGSEKNTGRYFWEGGINLKLAGLYRNERKDRFGTRR